MDSPVGLSSSWLFQKLRPILSRIRVIKMNLGLSVQSPQQLRVILLASTYQIIISTKNLLLLKWFLTWTHLCRLSKMPEVP